MFVDQFINQINYFYTLLTYKLTQYHTNNLQLTSQTTLITHSKQAKLLMINNIKSIINNSLKINNMNKLLFINHYNVATSKFSSYKQVPIQKHHIQTNFMRSSGPGGQSVNTTNSKAQIRINLSQCQFIDQFILNNLKSKYKNFINKQQEFVIRSQIHKSQGANLDDCITKAKKIIYECSMVPQQRKYDIPAQSDENKQKRLQSKKKKSDVKSRRQNNKFDFY